MRIRISFGFKYKYESYWVPRNHQIQIQISFSFPIMTKYEYHSASQKWSNIIYANTNSVELPMRKERMWLWYMRINAPQNMYSIHQGGRTWQPFVGSKNGNENFRQARIDNFRVKCVVFARNRKLAKLTKWNMQYMPCKSALLAQEILFLTQKGTFLPKDLQKVRK